MMAKRGPADSEASGRAAGRACRRLRSWLSRPRCNMALILANLMALQVLQICYFVIMSGTVRTLEKRFELRSTQTGFLASVGDIVQTGFVVFLAHLGGRVHKLRLFSGLMTFAGLGFLLMTLPYLIYGPKQFPAPEVTASDPAAAAGNGTGGAGVCVPGEELSDAASCSDSRERNSNQVAYVLFILANCVLGFGTAPGHALAMSYIDENTPKERSPLYIGVLSAAGPISPIIGSLIAAAVLSLPENLKESPVPAGSPNWIGAWWLGFAIVGSLTIICSIPLLLFSPRHQPYYYLTAGKEKRKETNASMNTAKVTGKVDVKTKLADILHKTKVYLLAFARDLARMMTNPAFLAITACYVCYLYVIIGVFINLGRYMEIHFRLTPFYANIVAGASTVGSAIGMFIGGYLMKRFRVTPHNAALIAALTMLISSCGTFINMWVTCDSVNISGTRNQVTGQLDVTPLCASNCSCSMKYYKPVCVDGSVGYFSPCHAGCQSYVNQTYSDCSCVPQNSTIKREQCEGRCSSLYIYLIVIGLTSLVGSLGRVPAVVTGLRVIDSDLKAFGLGIQTFLMNIFTFIPGPIIFGALFDSTCSVWQRSCGSTGVCLLYDVGRYRQMMHGPTAGFQLAAAMFAFLTYLLIRKHYPEKGSGTVDRNMVDDTVEDSQGTITTRL